MVQTMLNGFKLAQGKYKVGPLIAEGLQGQVYEVSDVTRECKASNKLIVKVSSHIDVML